MRTRRLNLDISARARAEGRAPSAEAKLARGPDREGIGFGLDRRMGRVVEGQ